jgi:hypothetical protein
MKQVFLGSLLLATTLVANAQPDRWQQRIKYVMDAQLNVQNNLLTGKQTITYTNNSPDTLSTIYLHLYWNAFRPNSSMDIRSRELGKTILGQAKDGSDILDWDARVKDRIQNLKPNEEGFCKVTSISMNGKILATKLHETILEVKLLQPVLPKKNAIFTTTFESQVPKQIRRSGANSKEGVQFSMSQWYPKMVEYDYQGWSTNQYIAREFYGVWGDYDITLRLDKNYKVAAGGTIQNPNEIGWGYDGKENSALKPIATPMRTWRFVANNVHDFVWAADTAYKHITRTTTGPLLHFIYKQAPDTTDVKWQNTANACAKAYPFMAKTFGAYPWPVYSFIQGGDGGMEYGMATLINSPSQGTAIHEWMHSWYQHLMGTNESLYPWMDEGFTTYAELRTSAWLKNQTDTIYKNAYNSYYRLVSSKREEPMSTHADHYNTNTAYSNASYSKGAVFLAQLGYIVGDKMLDNILLEYYKQWKFKHPNPNDFIRIAERLSGMQLQWYKEYWVYSTKTIDYGIGNPTSDGTNTIIPITRIGKMPMPIDVQLTFSDSTKELHTVPLDLMYGSKLPENNIPTITYDGIKWVQPNFNINTQRKLRDIIKIEIDPSLRLADVDRKNNVLEIKW